MEDLTIKEMLDAAIMDAQGVPGNIGYKKSSVMFLGLR